MATAQSVLLLAVFVLLISEFILAKRDYYDILVVARDATERQIKKAFHRLALKYHPDRNKGADAEAKFREIAEGKCGGFPQTFNVLAKHVHAAFQPSPVPISL